MGTKYIDVNKENYLKALFIDLEKSAKSVNYDDRSKIIHDFIMGHPSNDPGDVMPMANGNRLVLHVKL